MPANRKAYLYTDGAARGNPGPAGAGFAVVGGDGQIVFEGKRYLGEMTNNQAEYLALCEGLEKILELNFEEVAISMDSELIVRQVEGSYKVKNHGLKPHYKKVMELLDKFSSFSIKHIPREKNKAADRLANEAIDEVL